MLRKCSRTRRMRRRMLLKAKSSFLLSPWRNHWLWSSSDPSEEATAAPLHAQAPSLSSSGYTYPWNLQAWRSSGHSALLIKRAAPCPCPCLDKHSVSTSSTPGAGTSYCSHPCPSDANQILHVNIFYQPALQAHPCCAHTHPAKPKKL